jgi:hypothetical protein
MENSRKKKTSHITALVEFPQLTKSRSTIVLLKFTVTQRSFDAEILFVVAQLAMAMISCFPTMDVADVLPHQP